MGLYSAALVAFLLETTKKLEEDLEETAKDLLQALTEHILSENRTATQLIPTQFEIEPKVLIVNGLFLSSLCINLLISVTIILILQWIHRYTAHLSGLSAKRRALHRHFRYDGFQSWQVFVLVSTLLYALKISLVLFFAGLIVWFKRLHTKLWVVPIVFLGIGCLFYLMTTLLAVLIVRAPYDTPLSDSVVTVTRGRPITLEWREIKKGKIDIRALIQFLDWSSIDNDHFVETLENLLKLPLVDLMAARAKMRSHLDLNGLSKLLLGLEDRSAHDVHERDRKSVV